MRKSLLVLILTAILLAAAASAGGSQLVNYQGRLTDAAGKPVDSFFDIIYRLYSDSTGGTILWEEVQGVTVTGGLFSVNLGRVTPLDLSTFPVRADSLFLEIQVGGDPPISPRTRLTSVPMSAVSTSIDGDLRTSPGALYLDDDSDGDGVPTTITLRVDTSGALREMETIVASAVTKSIDKCSPKLMTAVRSYSDGTDSSFSELTIDSSGASLRMNKADLIGSLASGIADSAGDAGVSRRAARTGRNPQTGATITIKSGAVLNDTTGGLFGLSYLVDGTTAEALSVMSVDDSGASLSLSKADAKRALEALVSHRYVGLTLVDSTLNDSAMIDIRIDSSGNSGVDVSSARKVAKFKAGAALASTVNKAAGNGQEGAYLGIAGALDRYVEITVDSVSSSLVFGDTLGDTTVVLEADGSGNGRVVVVANNSAMGLPQSSVEISDLDSDGLVDIRVDGDVRLEGGLSLGVTSPTNVLQVAQGSLTDPIADAWTTYSSRRWKKNIKPIKGALGKVEQLRGVTYDWKADGKHDIGLIAEEVGEVFPEIVAFEENGVDARSVDYARLVAVLIEAVKELKSENDQLKSDLTHVELTSHDRLNKLQDQVTQLSSLLEQLMISPDNSIPDPSNKLADRSQQ